MESWTFGKAKEMPVERKPDIFKDYVVPFGSFLIPAIAYLAQGPSTWWGSLAIVAYMAIVVVFLVVPAIIRVGKKWVTYSERRRLEGTCLPKISAALRRFKPMMEAHRSDTIWAVWENAARASEMQNFIRPSSSHYYTLATWLDHLCKTADIAKSPNFESVASETSAWVRQYVSFCQDAYSQFENLLRNGRLDESKNREIRQHWNHVRDEHNQTITNWKGLCSEINSSFGQNVCNVYYV